MQEDLIIYKEDYELINDILKKLKKNTKAEIAFVTDLEGHCIASTSGADEASLNSISSLIAGSIAAVNSIAQMLGIEKFWNILTESVKKNLYISLINEKVMLVVLFDKSSNLGLVRLRVKKSTVSLEKVFDDINEKLEKNVFFGDDSPFDSVSDEEIDEIFGD